MRLVLIKLYSFFVKGQHFGRRPFVCTWKGCGKIMQDRWKLETHLRVHTGEKPFKCHFCDYAASQKINLKTHLRSMHSEFVPSVPPLT
ncbi:hypothetical protein CAPTEDRAFT_131093 [Capitella teleta]|uniref:C2H2-type domain-containing protein n=1 Tax=Capitella teleta TaxID=283909 RepID=R7VJ77_CAPTE|nr:hypothetical protein CAPTEDRAFT_131093 [Capitella teleta]|eukprot:ELU18674.1 hypothetical protein CAPTEDRAFT_131093 [Capitella teleta]